MTSKHVLRKREQAPGAASLLNRTIKAEAEFAKLAAYVEKLTGADARLIAAAPELLAALEAIVARADDARHDGMMHMRVATGDGGWMADVRAAIARARGGEKP